MNKHIYSLTDLSMCLNNIFHLYKYIYNVYYSFTTSGSIPNSNEIALFSEVVLEPENVAERVLGFVGILVFPYMRCKGLW